MWYTLLKNAEFEKEGGDRKIRPGKVLFTNIIFNKHSVSMLEFMYILIMLYPKCHAKRLGQMHSKNYTALYTITHADSHTHTQTIYFRFATEMSIKTALVFSDKLSTWFRKFCSNSLFICQSSLSDCIFRSRSKCQQQSTLWAISFCCCNISMYQLNCEFSIESKQILDFLINCSQNDNSFWNQNNFWKKLKIF